MLTDRSAGYKVGGPGQTAHSYGYDDLAGLDGGRGKAPKTSPCETQKHSNERAQFNSLPQVTENNGPQSMDAAEGGLFYVELWGDSALLPARKSADIEDLSMRKIVALNRVSIDGFLRA